VGRIVLPKKIIGCDNCLCDVELLLVNIKRSKLDSTILLTTYVCPDCRKLHYDSEEIVLTQSLR